MIPSSLSNAPLEAKKTNESSTLVNNGNLKAACNKSNKTTNNPNDTDKSQNEQSKTNNNKNNNRNKSNTILNNKNKSKDISTPTNHRVKKKTNENKNISIFYRPVKRKQPYKPSEVDFHIGVDFESFGKEAPTHILRSGRDINTPVQTRPTLPLDTPSPGDYNPVLVPSMVSPAPLQHYISRASSSLHGPIIVEGEMSRESNLKIDYIDPETYNTLHTKGNIKSSIGNVDHAPKFYSDQLQTALSVPGCTFIPSRELSLCSPMVKIGQRKPTNYETPNPGPGEYRPEAKMNSVLSRAPMHQLSGPQFRFDWLEDKRGIPDPSHYNPQRLETSSPQFSIGSKSRINKNNHQRKVNLSEESTRIALLNAESREVVTAPSKSRNRYRKSEFDINSNYYLPSEVNRKNRPKTGAALSTAAYYNERFNNTSSASRREKEKVNPKEIYDRPSTSYSSQNSEETVYSSFYSKCVNVNSNRKNIVPFPVGQFIMKLDVNSVPLNEARKYIAKHKELVAWVEFILDNVMYDKPENPLLYVREMFMEIKESEEQKNSIYTNDDYTISQVLVHMKEKTSNLVY